MEFTERPFYYPVGKHRWSEIGKRLSPKTMILSVTRYAGQTLALWWATVVRRWPVREPTFVEALSVGEQVHIIHWWWLTPGQLLFSIVHIRGSCIKHEPRKLAWCYMLSKLLSFSILLRKIRFPFENNFKHLLYIESNKLSIYTALIYQ